MVESKIAMPKKSKALSATGKDRLFVPVESIERRIYSIRGQRVTLDRDLAELYGVTTGNLNLAVRRNRVRFPNDFLFQLTREETASLPLQIARANRRGGRRTLPCGFTGYS